MCGFSFDQGARKPVTLWKRFDDSARRFLHNHIEDGHVPVGQDTPTIKHEAQRVSWKGALWVKFRVHLNDKGQIVMDEIFQTHRQNLRRCEEEGIKPSDILKEQLDENPDDQFLQCAYAMARRIESN